MPQAEFITGGASTGKTHKALILLAQYGSPATFVTRHLGHVTSIVKKLTEEGYDFSHVTFIEAKGRMIVDDADDINTTLVTFLPYGKRNSLGQ